MVKKRFQRRTLAARYAPPETMFVPNKRRLPLVAMHEFYDELGVVLAEHIADGESQGMHVTCSEGCAHARGGCCRMVVCIDTIEAEYIVERYPEVVQRALPELLRQHDVLGRELPLRDVEALFGDDLDRKEEICSHLFALDLVCPFLGADNRCQVYDARPIACRTHLALSSPEQCSVEGGEMTGLDTPLRNGAPAILSHRLLSQGADVRYSVLQTGVLAALGHPSVVGVRG